MVSQLVWRVGKALQDLTSVLALSLAAEHISGGTWNSSCHTLLISVPELDLELQSTVKTPGPLLHEALVLEFIFSVNLTDYSASFSSCVLTPVQGC